MTLWDEIISRELFHEAYNNAVSCSDYSKLQEGCKHYSVKFKEAITQPNLPNFSKFFFFSMKKASN